MPSIQHTRTRGLRARQRLGKYRIERKLAFGGFATVYQAMDTIEGIRVALKIPHADIVDSDVLREFRQEVRLTASLDHPNILPLKNASFIDDHFVIAFPLGIKAMDERFRHRMSLETKITFARQMVDAVAYAHRHRIIHCDIKPENFILFADNRVRLTDFGIAKIAYDRTVKASGSGTIGYIAPEQAMGKPSLRSDVFSLGLVLYRMFTGQLPEWPFQWPMAGHERLKGKVHPRLIALIRKAIDVNPRKRFRDGGQLQETFDEIEGLVLRHSALKRKGQRAANKRRRTTRRN
ncbi:MAG: serine/threonine protein kinase [Planctomycetaceae bacterium]|jgi:eukaryotic-like serine/threonine-protein kinase|nr:serine/threonine protein kinase [Planctomycetaceae bacterium]MBT6157605.1 serine/threonine protein kinase [Planctomycetaceae bacterium]MBT6486179.1 serine/threonine protein kinase [Planctomycetaceae bacterium]MBT6497868.1 serine/threonine protein kinase [Planctomycetaceae bacterium]